MISEASIPFWTIWIAIISIVLSFIWSVYESYLTRKQMKLSLFADYTKRYQEIILNLPVDINDNHFDINKLRKDDFEKYNQTIRYMKVYFDLCSEEFFLNKSGYIEKKVWEEWKEGIKYTFSLPAFTDVWAILTKDSSFYIEFKDWVNKEMII